MSKEYQISRKEEKPICQIIRGSQTGNVKIPPELQVCINPEVDSCHNCPIVLVRNGYMDKFEILRQVQDSLSPYLP